MVVLLVHSSFVDFTVIPHTFHIHSVLFLSPVPFSQWEIAGPSTVSQAGLFSLSINVYSLSQKVTMMMTAVRSSWPILLLS